MFYVDAEDKSVFVGGKKRKTSDSRITTNTLNISNNPESNSKVSQI